MSMVWPTLGSRTAKEQNSVVVVVYTDTGCAGQLRNRPRVLDSVQCCERVIASVCCYECACVCVN